MKPILFALATLTLWVLAYATHGADSSHATARQQTSAALSEGEVRRVDKDARRITIRHGTLANLEMPPMTMVFKVKDPAMLEQVKAGDKIRFEAQKIGDVFTVTRIEPAN
jgi:Cu/Ag efflux protein CusF